MSNATETTTTIPPCPSWCDAKPGHEYDTDIVSTSAIERHHNWDAPRVGNYAAWASISACEISQDGVVKVDAPYIYVSADEELTAAQAREYAADLIVAADKLDEINCA